MNHIDTMKLALEALENSIDLVSNETREVEKMYANVPTRLARVQGLVAFEVAHEKAITALREALEQPAQKCSYPYCGCNSKAWCKVERNEALDKMAENARELGLDYEPVCNKDPQGCWSVRCQLGKKCKNTPAQQEPMDFNSLFHEAEEIVRQKPTWKRFIDGTPLSNDIAVWMTVFAQDVARRTSPPAQQEPVAWTATRLWNRRELWTCPADIERDLVDGDTSPPAQRTWVNATTWRGLTDEEIEKLTVELRDIPVTLAFAIEAKLKEKNT